MLSLRTVLVRSLRRTFLVTPKVLNANNNNESEALPSTPEMKSLETWSESSKADSSITKTVVGMARNIQETSRPPLEIDKKFAKRFDFGSVYDPFDFTLDKRHIENKMRDLKKPSILNYDNGAHDPFVRAGISPLDLYMMPEVLSRFVSPVGHIYPREKTRCNPTNQKKLSIAIKRARSLGLLSPQHKHNRFTPFRIM